MALPIEKLTKAELVWLNNHHCKAHGHTYLEHYSCYVKEHRVEQEKLGFFDIEASNLKADFGIVLCYCIKPRDKNIVHCNAITQKDLRHEEVLDKRVIKDCVHELQQYDRIITHYGTRFDIPFLRSRALYWGVEFPKPKEVLHTDTYYLAKRLLCISSNRQGNIAQLVQHTNIKTRITSEHWLNALQGNEKSIAYIIDHCKRDVRQLQANFEVLIPYGRLNKTSI